MATIQIADNDARVQYTQAVTANTTQLTIDFPFFDLDDINVIVTTAAGVDTVLSRGTGTGTFAVTGTSVEDGYSGGYVTLGDTYSAGTDTFTIFRDIPITRTTDFPTSGPFNVASLNTELDKLTAIAQQNETSVSRTLQLSDSDTTVDLKLPNLDTRKGTTLAFNATTGVPEAGPTISDVQTVSDASADIATLADIEDGTVATNAISTVAGISSDVTTVSGISANVSTVSGISADVTAVAADATDIGVVSSNISSVNTVATNISDVIAVANDLNEAISEVETVANDLNEAVSEIDTVAGSISNVDTVGTNIANVNTVAGIDSNVTTVAGISANVTTVAGISGNVTTVAGISSDVTTVAADATDIGVVATDLAGTDTIGTVAGSISNVNTVGTNISSVNTNATNISSINTNATNITDIQNASANAASALASKNAAATSESNAATSETNAASSASSASTSASTATTQAGIATTKAGEAATSESNAATSATNAASSATAAASSASSASSAQTAAESARDATLAAYDNFDDRYLGAKSSAPTLDNDGNALVAGALYFDTVAEAMYVYTGSAWVAAYVSGTGFLALTGGTMTGTITFDAAQTFDGRDVSADGAKLDGIESGATADQTAAEIRTLVESATDSNVFTDADHSKLNGIEAGATADQTKADIDALGIDAATLDSIDSTQFLRSDAADTKTSGDLSFSDNVKATFGNSSDLQIYHGSSNSYISDQGTGNLNLQADVNTSITSADGATVSARFRPATNVSLYYNGAEKLETTSSGIDVTGTVTFDGGTTSADLNFGDNDKAVFGAGNDLKIYHDGSNSYVQEGGTGSLYLLGQSQVVIGKSDASATYAAFNNTGSVDLYFNNAKKLATKSDGVDITGELQADSLDIDGVADISGQTNFHSNVVLDDSNTLYFGNGLDLRIRHDGSNSYIHDNGTGSLYIDATQLNFRNGAQTATYADFTNGGASRLMHNGNVKFETTSSGISVTGTVAATSFTGDGSSLTGIAAGATGGGSDEIFWENGQTVTSNYTITNGKNAMSAGPITINTGVTVTVGTGETWTVV